MDVDVAIEMAAFVWQLGAEGRPVTLLAGYEVGLAEYVLELEPGEEVEVEHVSGDVLDCRRENLRRVEAGEVAG